MLLEPFELILANSDKPRKFRLFVIVFHKGVSIHLPGGG